MRIPFLQANYQHEHFANHFLHLSNGTFSRGKFSTVHTSTCYEQRLTISFPNDKVDFLLQPVTALAFVPVKQGSTPLLFAGEGPFLRIYGHDRLSCLASERIFDSQSIHGIIYSAGLSGPFDKESTILVLLWGGNSVCLLMIDHLVPQTRPGFTIRRISSTIRTDDWILDASFRPGAENDGNLEKDLFHVFLINGHNYLQCLKIQAFSYPECKYDWHLRSFVEGPKSILYSAHIGWSCKGRGLVAAGTVLGEVLLWSFHSDVVTTDLGHSSPYFLHHIFLGHEGSIFGVRVSDEPNDSLSKPAGRYLASCSDDRTIRVWDISSVDDEPAGDMFDHDVGDDVSLYQSYKASNSLVATTMGHSSRIWGLRFLHHTRQSSFLLSFGEDATSQIWHLRTHFDAVDIGQVGLARDSLQNEGVFEFHAKRNIWSAATHRDVCGNYIVSTGGADGRIICFSLNDDRGGLLLAGTSQIAEWTVSSILGQPVWDDQKSSIGGAIAAKSHVRISPENVFTTLKGHWNINRRLESEMSTYQSGNFEGVASFDVRSPTDPAYDAEYLYIENGEFRSDQGLVIPATRRYIYRFERKANAISAWFVKAEDGSTVDYLFHHVKLTPSEQGSFLGRNGRRRCLLEADGHHLCVEDDYQANYLFKFWDLVCDDWELKYHVKGPRKAYSATTQYARDALHDIANNDSMSEIGLKKTSQSGHKSETGVGVTVSDRGAFNNYSWVGKDQLLALTTQGHLLLGNVSCSGPQGDETVQNLIRLECLWVKVNQLANFESSCLVTSIQHPAITLFTGRGGNIYSYQQHKKSIKLPIQLSSKATYLKSHVIYRRGNGISNQKFRKVKLLLIASCLRPLEAHAFQVDVDLEISSYALFSSFTLTLRPHFIVASSCFANTKNLIFLGSRNGVLAVYEHSASSTVHANLTPSFVSHGINGRDAVTVIENLPLRNSASDTVAYILTAGRDGAYSIHLITTEHLQNQVTSFGFQTVHTCKLPFGPNVEGACFNRITEELWLWGFSSKDFVVWNESRKAKVMTVECGGAHRNWAFLPGDDDDEGGQFAWTRASSCRIYSQPQASHRVLQPGGHGREIKAAATSPPIKLLDGQFVKFVATGAEDTAIRIFLAPRITDETQIGPQGLQCLGIFTKHTTGLQQLRWSPNGQLLFSAAGCEEFFVWHVRPAPCVKIGLTCEAICPSVTEAADLRIMGFDVLEMGSHDDQMGDGATIHRYLLSMVYSDSTVRVSVHYVSLPLFQSLLEVDIHWNY